MPASTRARGPWSPTLPASAGGATGMVVRRRGAGARRGMMADVLPPRSPQSGSGEECLNIRRTPRHGKLSVFSIRRKPAAGSTRISRVDGLAMFGKGTTGTAPRRRRGSMPFLVGEIFPHWSGVLASECDSTKASIAPKNARARARCRSRARRFRGSRRKKPDVLQSRFAICSFGSQSTRGRLESV